MSFGIITCCLSRACTAMNEANNMRLYAVHVQPLLQTFNLKKSSVPKIWDICVFNPYKKVWPAALPKITMSRSCDVRMYVVCMSPPREILFCQHNQKCLYVVLNNLLGHPEGTPLQEGSSLCLSVCRNHSLRLGMSGCPTRPIYLGPPIFLQILDPL